MWKLPKLFKRAPKPVALPDSADAMSAVEDIVHYARLWVRGGYMSRAEIVDSVLDMAEDEGLDPMLFDAESLVASEIAELKAEQMRWPSITEWDRLDAALEALELQGVVARADFTCCGTCGAAAIGAELDAHERSGARAQGYVFFHQQDTEHAVDGHGLYFNYGGAQTETEDEHIAVAKRLVAAMSAAGLEPKWNGELSQRVFVPIDWKRRWVE